MKPVLRLTLTGAVLASATIAALANPFDTLLAKGNGAACYERVYDAAHLSKHPGQRTQSMLLSLSDERDVGAAVLRIRMTRAKSVLYIVGECGFSEKANLDVMGEKLIDAFKGPSGLDCHVSTSADGFSAEEGGDFPIDLRDGKAIVVYFPEDLAAWRSVDRSQPADFESFGKEDQVFRVDRTAASTCSELVTTLPDWK